MIDPYYILGVHPYTNQKEIKVAFKRRAKQTHPDRFKDKIESERQFNEVVYAYLLLSPNRRNKDYEWYKQYFKLSRQRLRMFILIAIIVGAVLGIILLPFILVLTLMPDSIGAYYIQDLFRLM